MKLLLILSLTVALAYAQTGSASFGAKTEGGQVATEVQSGGGGKPADEPNASAGAKVEVGGKGDADGQGEAGGKGESGGKGEGGGKVEAGGKVEGGKGEADGQGEAGGNGESGGKGESVGKGEVQGGINGGGQVQGQVGGSNGQGGASISGSGFPNPNDIIKGIASAASNVQHEVEQGVESFAKPIASLEHDFCAGIDHTIATLIRNGSLDGQPYTVNVNGKVVSQGKINGGNQNKRKIESLFDKLKGLKDDKKVDGKDEPKQDGKGYGGEKPGKPGKPGKNCKKHGNKKHTHQKHEDRAH